jgi:DNA invertase Pin-like site-specific DNA recombinase
VARLEATANVPEAAEALRESLTEETVPEVTRIEDHLMLNLSRGRLKGTAKGIKGKASLPPPPPARRPSLKLRIPKATKKPNDFYRRVAQIFSELQRQGIKGPANEVAAANEVPVSTVHRWLKEARRRGLLGPGQREKETAG